MNKLKIYTMMEIVKYENKAPCSIPNCKNIGSNLITKDHEEYNILCDDCINPDTLIKGSGIVEIRDGSSMFKQSCYNCGEWAEKFNVEKDNSNKLSITYFCDDCIEKGISNGK